MCLTIFKIFAGAYLKYLSELSKYLSDNIPKNCPKIFKIFVREYSKYGYSANSICAGALDKIFVVAAAKYELTPKWFCFGSYLPRDHQLDFSICATMVRGWTCFGQITFLGVRLPICLGRLLTFCGCSFDRDCLLGRFPDLDQGLNLILGFLIGLFPTGSLLLILGSTLRNNHQRFS